MTLPAIQADHAFTDEGLSWICNAYVIAFGGLLLLGGKLADVFGPRRLFLSGFGLLTLASLLAGMAREPAMLLVWRVAQGAGAAFIAPAVLTILMRLFGAAPQDLGRAFGFWGASAAAGGTAGVFLGGVITGWTSWQWTFLINIPFGLLVMALGTSLLPAIPRSHGRIGLVDAALVTAAISLAVYAIVTG